LTKLALLPSLLALALASPPPQEAETPEPEVGLRLIVATPVREGMGARARSVAHRINLYERANHPEWNSTAFVEYSVGFSKLYQFQDFPSMTALEEAFEAYEREDGLRELGDEYEQCFDTEGEEMSYLLPVTEVAPAREDRPFRWMRITRANFGSYASAVDHARRVAEYVNANYDETRFEVYMAYFGGLGEIHWMADYAGSEAWRATRARLWADPDYVALMSEAASLYVDGTWEEALAWRMSP
jgi:hypothetical protein